MEVAVVEVEAVLVVEVVRLALIGPCQSLKELQLLCIKNKVTKEMRTTSQTTKTYRQPVGSISGNMEPTLICGTTTMIISIVITPRHTPHCTCITCHHR